MPGESLPYMYITLLIISFIDKNDSHHGVASKYAGLSMDVNLYPEYIIVLTGPKSVISAVSVFEVSL